jgi:hypothetical protein
MIKKVSIFSLVFIMFMFIGLVGAVDGDFLVEELFQSAADPCGNDYLSVGTFLDNSTAEIRHCIRTTSFNPGDSYLRKSYLYQTTSVAGNCPTGAQSGFFKGFSGDILLCVESKVPENGDYLSTDALVNETCPTDAGWFNSSTEEIQIREGKFVRHCSKMVEITDVDAGICGNFTGIIPEMGTNCKYKVLGISPSKREDAGIVKSAEYEAGDNSCPDTLTCTCSNDAVYNSYDGWNCVDASGVCTLDNLEWLRKDGSKITVANSVFGWYPDTDIPPGEEVLLIAESTPGCDEEEINFVVYESDYFIDDFQGSVVSRKSKTGLRWEATWRPPLIVDGLFGLGKSPEFYFREEIDGKIRNSVSGKIRVIKPACTNSYPDGCIGEGACLDVNNAWLNGKCVSGGTVCTPNRLDLCVGKNSCELDGQAYWDGSVCRECMEDSHCPIAEENCVDNKCVKGGVAGNCVLGNARWTVGGETITSVDSGDAIGMAVDVNSGMCENLVFVVDGRNAPPSIGAQSSGSTMFTGIWHPSVASEDKMIFGDPTYTFSVRASGSNTILATSGSLLVISPECDTTHLDLCSSSSDCSGAEGDWFEGSCRAKGEGCELNNPEWRQSNGVDEVSGSVDDGDRVYLVVDGNEQCSGKVAVFDVTYSGSLPGTSHPSKYSWEEVLGEDGASRMWEAQFLDVGVEDLDFSDYRFEAYVKDDDTVRSGQSPTLNVLGDPKRSGGCLIGDKDDSATSLALIITACAFVPSICAGAF